MAWRSFRSIYAAKKDSIIRVMANAPVLTDPTGTKTYYSYFADVRTTIASGTGITNINSKADVETALQNFYKDESTCDGYALLWWNKLTPCDTLKLQSYKKQVLADLVMVCKKGTDKDHIMGASSIAPGALNTYKDFDEVLAHYVQLYNSANPGTPIGTLDCNASLLNFPAPYSTPQVVADKPVINKPEACECEKLTALHTAYLAEKKDVDFSAYILRTLQTAISNGALDTLMSLCAGTPDCRNISQPIYLPPALQCGMDNICVPCSAVAQAYNDFKAQYPGYLPATDESATEQQGRVNELFSYYMNKRFGFSRLAQEYLAFIDSCGFKDQDIVCDSLTAFVKKYRRDISPYRLRIAAQSNELVPPVYITDPNVIVGEGTLRWPKAIRDTTGRDWVYFQQIAGSANFCLEAGFSIEFSFKFLKKVLRPVDDVFYLTSANAGIVIFKQEGANAGLFLRNINTRPDANSNPVDIFNGLALMDADPDIIYKTWSTVKIRTTRAAIEVYFNGRLIQSAPRMDAPLMNGGAFTLSFLDYQAAIDWFKIYDGNNNVVCAEDYNDAANRAQISPSFLCPQPSLSCEQSFTNYFNQQKGTSFTFSQIDSLYRKTCGKGLDVCGTTQYNSDTLKNIVDSFYVNAKPGRVKHVRNSQEGQLFYDKQIIKDGIVVLPDSIRALPGTWYNNYQFDFNAFCTNNGYTIETKFKFLKDALYGDVFYLGYRSIQATFYRDAAGLYIKSIDLYNYNYGGYPTKTIPVSILVDTSADATLNWMTIKAVVKPAKYELYYNGKKVYEYDRDPSAPIANQQNFGLGLRGRQGAVDWVRVADVNDSTMYFEDFNDTTRMATVDPAFNCSGNNNCQLAFTNYYNQKQKTNYTYSQIDSIYKASGIMLDACRLSLTDSLTYIADNFTKHYDQINNNGVNTGLPSAYWTAGGVANKTDQLQISTDQQQLISNGILHMPAAFDTMYYGFFGYYNSRGFCINNEYAFELRIKNFVTPNEGGDVVLGTNTHSINTNPNDIDEDFAVDFVPNCPHCSWYRLRGKLTYDTSFSFKDFQDWRVIKISVKTDSFRVYYEGKLVFKLPRDGRSFIDRIGMHLGFQQGLNAQVDWVKYYGSNDELIFFEDFNDAANPATPKESALCPPVDCKTKFTAYFNRERGASYTYSQIDSIYASVGKTLEVCNSDTTTPVQYADILLCGKNTPNAIPFKVIDDSPCADSTNFSISRGYERYNAYSDSVRGEFMKTYINKCLEAAQHESFTVIQPVSEYHYTLYYYDQAGNLIKTVPPKGVKPNYDETWLQQVKTARENNTVLLPAHELPTQYRYNTLNQVVEQRTPDAGKSEFWYDRLGRLAISQNAKQALTDGTEGQGIRYSYTRYDYLGRITEVGQIDNGSPAITSNISRNPVNLQNWYNSNIARRQQVTLTVYDQAAKESYLHKDLSPYILRERGNLRNRVSFTVFSRAGDISNYDYAAFYNYDIHGNVDTLLQDYGSAGVMTQNGSRYKRVAYSYDLISGKVNTVSYQPRLYDPVTKKYITQPDAFYHRYEYDAENRLTDVFTSANQVHWEHDAYYRYYKHGPLSRMVLGDQQVQGLDYAYTLQGWLKGVNSTAVGTGAYDAGQDGINSSPNRLVARDAFGFSLQYYGNDYTPITNSNAFAGITNAFGSNAKPLYNGNISSMAVNIPKLGDARVYAYTYDQLNRITAMDAYGGLNNNNNSFTPLALDDYKERISYDANGNILTYTRNGNKTGAQKAMDNLTYNYKNNTNQLAGVRDAVAAANYTEDIDDQPANNYDYDKIGNLVKDTKEGITNITWTVYGKIESIHKTDNSIITYTYDAAGNRINKAVTKAGATTTTAYVRDAQGNTLSIYEQNSTINSGHFTQSELHLYGSSRLGVYNINKDLSISSPALTNLGSGNSGSLAIFERNKKLFELTNHLGNVLATVSDEKVAVSTNGNTIDYYIANVVSANDYYPGGMIMPGRKYGTLGRFGFNGMEQSPEIKGEGNSYTAEYWEYDSRLVRRWNIDPVIKDYESPYMCFSGNPILFNDPDGDDPDKPKENGTKEGQTQSTSETKFVPAAAARGGTWRTTTTNWSWHEGGVMQNNGKLSEAGWYDPSGYSKVLTPIASDLAGYQSLYSGPAGHNWSAEEKANVANTRLGKFVGNGLSENTANVLASTAQSYANKRNFMVSGVTYASGFNVEDMIGVGLLAKELMKGLGGALLRRLPQGGSTFAEYKALRGGTETLDFIRTTNKQGQVVFQRISTEFHHAIISQKTQKAMGLPNWMVNNRINVWKLNTIQHSLIDPARRQFLRAGLKTEIGFFGNMQYNWFTKFPK
ncbi:MAG: RHS repeat protein [Chitinophagaceae bacterium]|nr:RHS repeat protein [Chitinophagaceae bacterium]